MGLNVDFDKCKEIAKELDKWKQCIFCCGCSYRNNVCRECAKYYLKRVNAYDGVEYE